MLEALVSLSLPNMGTREADPTKILLTVQMTIYPSQWLSRAWPYSIYSIVQHVFTNLDPALSFISWSSL